MGRFHRHDDEHAHDHGHHHDGTDHGHDHEHAHGAEHDHPHSHSHSHAAEVHLHLHVGGPCSEIPAIHLHIHGDGHGDLVTVEHTHAHEHSHSHPHEHSHDHGHEGHGHAHEHDAHEHEHGHGHSHDHLHLPDHADDPHLGDHTGYDTGRERIAVLEDIFSENDRSAEANRHAFDQHNVVAINLMSSPGAGKTTLLQHSLKELAGRGVRVGVIEGDIETGLDADRLDGLAAQVSLLNTGNGFGGECHLDAPMVAHALEGLDLNQLDLVLVENVGNLVCPAEFEVGEHHKVMIYAVTEGEDKPLKYPVMFRAVETVVINKIDLLSVLDFDMELFKKNLASVNPDAHIIELSCVDHSGIEQWVDWLESRALRNSETSDDS